jgi:hypothetical protein
MDENQVRLDEPKYTVEELYIQGSIGGREDLVEELDLRLESVLDVTQVSRRSSDAQDIRLHIVD